MFPFSGGAGGAEGAPSDPWASAAGGWNDPRNVPPAADWATAFPPKAGAAAPGATPPAPELAAPGSPQHPESAPRTAAQLPGSAPPGPASPSGGVMQGALFNWLLTQVKVLIDSQINTARNQADQNFKVEMGRMQKEVQSIQVITEQQSNVTAALSKDLGGVAQELVRINTQLNAVQQQMIEQRQLSTRVQLALDRGIKQLVDMDKRLHSVGAPPSVGMMRALNGAMADQQMMEKQQQLAMMHGVAPNTAGARSRHRKAKKDGGKSLRADAPAFVPGGAPEAAPPAADAA